MDIKVGAVVMGTNGKLGEVTRVTFDEHTHSVDELVIRHGVLLRSERLVPLPHVLRVEDDVVYLDLDDKAFDAMEGYAEKPYDSRKADLSGSLRFDIQGVYTPNLVTVTGQSGRPGDPTSNYPSVEQIIPPDKQMPVIAVGTNLFDVNGEKIGEVGEFSVDPQTEALTRLSVRRGFVFKRDSEVPVNWVQEITVRGIVLNVAKEEVQTLEA